jgi:hypothetical protein
MAPIMANTNSRAGKVTNLGQTKGSLKPSMKPLKKSGDLNPRIQPMPWKTTPGKGEMEPTVKKSSGRTPPIYNPNGGNRTFDLKRAASNRISGGRKPANAIGNIRKSRMF